MISWSDTFAVIYKTTTQPVRPQSSPKKGKTSICIERKTNECHLKIHVHQHAGYDSHLYFSKMLLLIFIGILDKFAEEMLCYGSQFLPHRLHLPPLAWQGGDNIVIGRR